MSSFLENNSFYHLSLVSLIVQLVKNLPAMQDTQFRFLGWEDPWRRDRLPISVFLGFPFGSAGKESAAMQETWVQSLGWEDTPGEEKGYPLQYSGLETIQSMGSQKSDTTEQLSPSLHQFSKTGSQASKLRVFLL